MEGQPVLGVDLNRSKSGASGQQSHDWTANPKTEFFAEA